MKVKLLIKTIASAILLGGLAQISLAADNESGGNEELRAKGGPLLALILKPFLDAATTEATSAASGLFSGLMARMKGGDGQSSPQAASPSATSSSPVPAIAIAIHQLNPQNYKFEKALPVNAGVQTLKTGDVFAVIFSTNVPGQVRVQNIDAKGVVTKLGTYSVLPGRENRLPRSKGIQLVGDPGRETFNFFFAPCVPQEVAHQAAMQGFVGHLGRCGDEVTQSLQLITQTAQPTGSLRARAAVNLELDGADPDVVIAAVPDFKPKDIVTDAISVDHSR